MVKEQKLHDLISRTSTSVGPRPIWSQDRMIGPGLDQVHGVSAIGSHDWWIDWIGFWADRFFELQIAELMGWWICPNYFELMKIDGKIYGSHDSNVAWNDAQARRWRLSECPMHTQRRHLYHPKFGHAYWTAGMVHGKYPEILMIWRPLLGKSAGPTGRAATLDACAKSSHWPFAVPSHRVCRAESWGDESEAKNDKTCNNEMVYGINIRFWSWIMIIMMSELVCKISACPEKIWLYSTRQPIWYCTKLVLQKILDDGWPESTEEHVTLVLIYRECKEYIKDML